MTQHLSILLCSLLLLSACQKAAPRENDLRLAEAYSSLLILQEQFKSPGSTLTIEQYRQRRDSILSSHGFTHENFQSALQQIAKEPAEFRAFSQRLSERLPYQKNP